MPKSPVSRRAAAAAAIAGLTLSSGILATPVAQAAPTLTWDQVKLKQKGSTLVDMFHPGANIGSVFWSADPQALSSYGDSLYVNDKAKDGYSIRGQVKLVKTGEIIISVSTAGKTAPVRVRKTKNLSEGTKLKVRGCVQKAGKTYGCTDWYSAHA